MNGLTGLQGINGQLMLWMKKTLLLMICSFALHAHAATKYVKPMGSDTNSGNSWTQAYQTLQKAIEASVAGDEIWLASGTYYPTKDNAGTTPAGRRLKTFFASKNIAIYGGFRGTESSLAQRNWRTNIATLIGDIGIIADDRDDNGKVYHMMYSQGVSAAIRLDGVTVTPGNGNNGDADGFNDPAANGIDGGILVHATGGPTPARTTTSSRVFDPAAGGEGIASVGSGSSTPTFTNFAGPQPALQSNNTGVSDYSGTSITEQKAANAPALVVGCNLSTYQSATIIGAGNFPYTSGTGITVNASTNVETLSNTNYSCGGNSFSTAPTAWWLDDTQDFITLTFSAPVTSFSMVMNGTNIDEVFTFTSATGTVSLSEFCAASFEVVGTGNQLRCKTGPGTFGTLVNINNPTGSTQYTITHNGVSAGSRISLLDCYVAPPLPVVNSVNNVQACGTETVPAIAFTGTAGATFNWTNNNTAIGLAASGTGNIASFTAANVTSQQDATITVTPVSGSLSGTPVTFTITVKPKPTLTITGTVDPASCGGFSGRISFATTNVPNGIHSLSYTGAGSPQNVIVSGNAILLSGRNAGTYSNFSISVNGCAGTAAGPVTLTDPTLTWYKDVDGDDYSDGSSLTQCLRPANYYIASELIATTGDCDDNDPLEKPGQVWYDDTDNDGYGQTGAASITQCLRPTGGYKAASELIATTGDCNDANATINPAATEVCDGVDNDCDGSTDEGGLTTYYRDMDGDTFGNPAMTQQACSQPVGYVTNSTDCDDTDALEFPGQVWYDDTDNDGYGQTGAASITQCLRPTGYRAAVELLATSGDCNDNNAAIKPGATEVCDGVDNDCDGSIDEGVLTTYYRDMDGDGFGNASNTTTACSVPTGYVTNSTDCDDTDALEFPGQVWYDDTDNDGYGQTGAASITQCLRPTGYRAASELTATTGDCNDANATINPAATEVCDGVDNDCDGSTDEGGLTTYYRDMDGDTFGNPAMTQQACSQPVGYVTNSTDCDDTDALEFPGQVWYDDTDNDGYGQTGAASITQCLRPTGYRAASELTATTGDCNDANATINPAATEVCDGIDNDCDGSTDEGVLTTYYRDMDGDGFGNASNTTTACSVPTGYVTNSTDCDDNDALEFPGQVWYDDTDNDGYGQTGAASITQCLRPTGYRAASELTATTGDCNDANATINPAATEVCDGIDNDCDGSTDEGVLTTYYRDMDGDGFGNASNTTMACSVPTGYVTNSTDCDDNDALEFPGQVWYQDADGDDYSDGSSLTQCLRPTNHYAASELIATSGDCNDGAAAINPAATEVCDGVDNNCDGMLDNGTLTTYYQDSDGDGFGNAAMTQQACSQPTGYVTNSTDCDDNDALEFPGQVWYKDVDGDDYSDGSSLTQCLRPTNHYAASELIATTGDCNDNNAAIRPNAIEVCDGIDNDCDGSIDDGVLTTYYRDMDGDGFGNASNTTMACSVPTGYVTNSTDCDDNDALEFPGQVWYKDVDGDDYSDGSSLTQCLRPTNHYAASELIATTGDCNDAAAAINPAATEVCDGIDNDCDGSIDDGVLTTYYRDMDGDGFGNASNTTMACSVPTGYVTNNTDCDDNDALEFPGQVWYKDVDGDDYSDGSSLTQCLRPTNHYAASELIATTGDCNDAAAAINPAATEVCDGIDNDCDGSIDDGVLTTYYRDMDGDGFGNPSNTTMACSVPTGYVTNSTDCDDNDALEFPGQVWYKDVDGDDYSDGTSLTQCLRPTNHYAASELIATTGDCNDGAAAINPAATEVCDGIDNDCDGSIDDGVLTTYYRDMDGDGFGNASNTTMACSVPTGYVTNSTDCDDNDALEFPGQVWYKDVDGDDYSDGTSLTQCLRPTNHYAASELIATTGDCNDNNAAINPAATEVCDGIDNDCDGSIDDGVLTTYYRDLDGDGFGNASNTTMACSVPTGYVTNNTDCDDNDALEKPGQVWYKDVDGDDYSDGTSLTQCLRPANHYAASELIATTGDCNDNNAAIRPNATEVCDGVDNDCDGSIDEGVLTTYYRDLDGDGFGNPSNTTMACSVPTGYVTNNTDCDDNDALEFPGQVWYKDVDGDDYSDGTSLTQCLRPTNYYLASELTATTGDCNDGAAAINPAATEVCDGVDNDCDGGIDEGVQTTYYADTDGDGFGDGTNFVLACSLPTGYVTNNTDCDDKDDLERPGQVWYQDADGDGYSNSASLTQCLRPVNYYVASELTATDGDCNDGDANVNPDAEEVCDDIDNDCNGQIDDLPGGLGNWQEINTGIATGAANFPACEADPQDVFTLNSTGVSSPTNDNIQLVYQRLCGNSQITARVRTVSGGGWAGIMMRESLSEGSKKVALKTQLSNLIRREIRSVSNGPTSNLQFVRPQHVWLRLTRSGSTLTGYTSMDGQNWSFAFTATISMEACIYVGVFSESINGSATTTATFDNVSVMGTTSAPLQQQLSGFEEGTQNWDIDVYPNPSNGFVNVRLLHPSDQPASVRVFNALGEQVLYLPELPLNESQWSLNLTSLHSGVYHLILEVDGQAPLSKRVILTQD